MSTSATPISRRTARLFASGWQRSRMSATTPLNPSSRRAKRRASLSRFFSSAKRSINVSDAYFTPHGEAIRFGLAAVKNVGHNAIESIVAARKEAGDDGFNGVVADI